MPTRGSTWCCTLVEYSQLYWRVPQPNRVSGSNCATDVACPKLRFDATEHSPFACRLTRSQSGLKSRSRSVQLRVTEATTPAGLPVAVVACTYLPRLTFSA